MADFKNPAGSFNTSHAADRDPKKSGTPSAGITNDSKGQRNPTGAGPGTPANSSRIR